MVHMYWCIMYINIHPWQCNERLNLTPAHIKHVLQATTNREYIKDPSSLLLQRMMCISLPPPSDPRIDNQMASEQNTCVMSSSF